MQIWTKQVRHFPVVLALQAHPLRSNSWQRSLPAVDVHENSAHAHWKSARGTSSAEYKETLVHSSNEMDNLYKPPVVLKHYNAH